LLVDRGSHVALQIAAKAAVPAEPAPVPAPQPATTKAAPAAPAPAQPSEGSSIGLLGALALLLAGAGACWLLLRRGKGRLGGDGLQILSVRSLGPKARVAVVEAGGRRLLLGVTDRGIRVLGRLHDRGESQLESRTLAGGTKLEIGDPKAVAGHTATSPAVTGLLRLRAGSDPSFVSALETASSREIERPASCSALRGGRN
jgi:flagellar biogenesis protein FliO